MYRFLYFLISVFSIVSSVAGANQRYEIAPSGTPVKIDTDLSILQKQSKAMEKLAETSAKGLVFIAVSKTVSTPEYIDPFEYFFGRPSPNQPQRERKQVQEGFGSGFFIDLNKGYILTNNHVVENADKITLTVANGKSYEGKIIGHDKDTDVAVVQVIDSKFSRENLVELVLDDSDKAAVGATVIAIGAPFLLKASVSKGIISAIDRGNLSLTKMGNFIQTDAAINPGNSGGPLINMEGKVVGVNSAIYSQTGAYAGIGFAIPANIARRIATALINNERSYKGFVGISYELLNEPRARSLDLPKSIKKGIIIAEVIPGGPAQIAGLKPWDVIVAVDGKEFEPENLTSLIGLREPGAKIRFTVYRQGKKLGDDVEVVVGTPKLPRETTVASNASHAGKGKAKDTILEQFGISLEVINDHLRKQCELPKEKTGLVVSYLESRSSAWHQLRECDVITGVNGKKVTTIAEFEESVKGRTNTLLQVDRKGRPLFAELKNENKK